MLKPGEKPPEGAQMLPPEYHEAARRKLAGRREAYVSLTSGGKLSMWAAQQRKKKRENERKARRNMAKASRRRNRR